MTTRSLPDTLADLARRLRPELARMFATVETTAPGQLARLTGWLAQCLARQEAAATEEALAEALRNLVTLRNGQLAFTAVPVRLGGRPEAVATGDLGGAVALGQAVVDLIRCVAACDPDLALRLSREVRRTELQQRAEIARAIGWR